ncbi:signal peptidase complex subunit Spase12 [Dermatophagoides pteronyssinus]|uniref:Signal peptidase complex subunit 1 n=2 Tax=Dermatophagoides pteronyssinus TaxID=6956 RepID=A0A6P6YL19_DERPT|nr:signal peptidase complex subunit 1-like [Dermatophagoides pteronyssinus]
MFEDYTKSLYMDFDGQHRAESYFERIVILSSIIGLIVGYAYQQISLSIIILGVGFVISSLLTIPPWPMYRRSPLKWQKHDPTMFEDYQAISGDECHHHHHQQQNEPQPSGSGQQQSKKNTKNKNN